MTDAPSLKKPLLFWLVTIVALHVFNRLGHAPGLGEYMAFFSAAVLLYPPILFSGKGKIGYLQFDFKKVLSDLKLLLIVCVLVFPALAGLNHFYQDMVFGRSFAGLSDDAAWVIYLLNQVVLVALPEEVFFRGYLEDAFEKRFPTARKIWGAPFGKASVINALVFAFSHSLITFQWWHFSIFFPALLFGWLRRKTGTIWIPTLFHALANLFSYFVALSYR